MDWGEKVGLVLLGTRKTPAIACCAEFCHTNTDTNTSGVTAEETGQQRPKRHFFPECTITRNKSLQPVRGKKAAEVDNLTS